jgi:putative ABC transport system permease protein
MDLHASDLNCAVLGGTLWTRAFGVTPDQIAFGLSGAQVLAAITGGVVGLPAGYMLFVAVSNGEKSIFPPAWWLIALLGGTVLVSAALTWVPARLAARKGVAELLQSEGT